MPLESALFINCRDYWSPDVTSGIYVRQTDINDIRNRHRVLALAEGTWNEVFCSESEQAAASYMQKRFASYPYVRLMRVEVAEVFYPGDKIEDENEEINEE